VERTISNGPENALRLCIIESRERFEELRSSWSKLVERIPTASIFQTFQWNFCWWQAFGKHDKLFVIACYRGSRLVGIAPLMVTRGRFSTIFPRTEIRFIGCKNYASDYLDFIIDPDAPEALEAILNKVLENLKSVNRIRFSHFPTHFENQSRLHDLLLMRKSRFTVELEQKAPYRLMGEAIEDHKIVNKPTLRRRYNYFMKSGDLRFHPCVNEAEIMGYMDVFFDQHVTRRDLTHAKSQFLNPDQRTFYQLLVTELQPTKWLRFDAVLFNGQPLAFHFGFEFRNKFIWYKPTFDVRYYKHSPGQVLIKFLLEDTIEKNLDEFDFTVGSESFKYRFANRERYNNRFIVFRSSLDYWTHHVTMTLTKIRERMRQLRARLHSL
jgi:CelD/BcsL family acetyltransferase involved in cellulose biosynthesis